MAQPHNNGNAGAGANNAVAVLPPNVADLFNQAQAMTQGVPNAQQAAQLQALLQQLQGATGNMQAQLANAQANAHAAAAAATAAAEKQRKARYGSVSDVADDIQGKLWEADYVEIPIVLHPSCEEVSRHLMAEQTVQYNLDNMTAVFVKQTSAVDNVHLVFAIKLTHSGSNSRKRTINGVPKGVQYFPSVSSAGKALQIQPNAVSKALSTGVQIKRQVPAPRQADDVLRDVLVDCHVGFTFVDYCIAGTHLPVSLRQLLELPRVREGKMLKNVTDQILLDTQRAAAANGGTV